MKLSYNTAKRLRGLVELLPSGAAWSRVEIDRKLFPSKDPIYLYKHDAVECIEDLFRNPLFQDHMSFTPTKLFKSAENMTRIYTEWMTGDNAHDFQVCNSCFHFFSLLIMCYRISYLSAQQSLEQYYPPTKRP